MSVTLVIHHAMRKRNTVIYGMSSSIKVKWSRYRPGVTQRVTAALEGGEWSVARPGRTLPPGKTRYPFYRRLGEPQGRSRRAENLVPTGIGYRTVQPVVSRYTDWGTGPTVQLYIFNTL